MILFPKYFGAGIASCPLYMIRMPFKMQMRNAHRAVFRVFTGINRDVCSSLYNRHKIPRKANTIALALEKMAIWYRSRATSQCHVFALFDSNSKMLQKPKAEASNHTTPAARPRSSALRGWIAKVSAVKAAVLSEKKRRLRIKNTRTEFIA
jgi:hypothetical protein